MPSKLERDIRFLKIYATLATLVVAVLLLAGFNQVQQKQKFGEIDVERINVVEKDGKLDLVISNSERMPPALVNGKTFPPKSPRGPGMLFYNGKGDEDGGLSFGSRSLPDGKYSASGQIMFDQYNNDQIVGISYSDNNGSRTAGLHVWDRSDTPLDQIMAKIDAAKGPDREALLKKMIDAGEVGAHRVFVGKLPDKSAQLVLSDTKGKARLTVSVDAAGNPKISFLDEAGKVTYSLPPAAAQ